MQHGQGHGHLIGQPLRPKLSVVVLSKRIKQFEKGRLGPDIWSKDLDLNEELQEAVSRPKVEDGDDADDMGSGQMEDADVSLVGERLLAGLNDEVAPDFQRSSMELTGMAEVYQLRVDDAYSKAQKLISGIEASEADGGGSGGAAGGKKQGAGAKKKRMDVDSEESTLAKDSADRNKEVASHVRVCI